jgi:transposase
MVRRLDMHKTQGIEHLYATGLSKRKIAKTLGINRKSIDRQLAEFQPKGANTDQSPPAKRAPGPRPITSWRTRLRKGPNHRGPYL